MRIIATSYLPLVMGGGYSLSDLAFFSDTRIAATKLDRTDFVGVDNLLPERGGKLDSTHVPSTGNLTAYKAGDVLLGNIRPYLKKIWLAEGDGGSSADVLVIRIRPEFSHRLRPDYLFQVLASDSFFRYDTQHSRGGKMPRGDKKAIMNFPVPVPALVSQDRVSKLLNHFDSLLNDLSVGLPAELNARREQYEYYRDKLLTFEELDKSASHGDSSSSLHSERE